MNGLPGYYGQPYSIMDQQSMDAYNQDGSLEIIDHGPMDQDIMGQPQTLHQIISQNNEQLMRRRAFQSEYPQNTHDHTRRASMHEFGSSVDTDIANFQFDPNPNDPSMSMPMAMPGLPSPSMSLPQKPLDPRRVRSREDLSLNTRFSQLNARFGDMSAVATYSPAMISGESVGLEPSPAYISQTLDVGMDYDAMSRNANAVTIDTTSMPGPIYSASPVAPNFSVPYAPTNPALGASQSAGPRPQAQASPMGAGDMVPASMSQPFAHPQNLGQMQTAISNPLPTTSAPTSTMPSALHIQRTPSRGQSMDMAPRMQTRRKYKCNMLANFRLI